MSSKVVVKVEISRFAGENSEVDYKANRRQLNHGVRND